MQVTKQQLEEKEIQIAELKTLCEQQRVCLLTLCVCIYTSAYWCMGYSASYIVFSGHINTYSKTMDHRTAL